MRALVLLADVQLAAGLPAAALPYALAAGAHARACDADLLARPAGPGGRRQGAVQ